MSKNRPRATAALSRPGTAPRLGAPSANVWSRRVFRNSYTYKGQLVNVRGWSVKLQYQGHRRTLALQAQTRRQAGREAAALYRRLRLRGWSALGSPAEASSAPAKSGTGAAERTKQDVRYWEARLLRRNYPAPAVAAAAPLWSIRLEHGGTSHYLPLGTSDSKEAAARALALYRQVTAQGWAAASECLIREITIGIHWSFNPVGWTYSTFHTQPDSRELPPASQGTAPEPGMRIGLLEADASISRALQHWLRAGPVPCAVVAHTTIAGACLDPAGRRVDVWLVNSSQNGTTGAACLEQMKRRAPGLRGWLYSVYEDSNQLFLATPGGAAAYLLKRTRPDRLLEPILGDRAGLPASPTELLTRLKLYFQSTLQLTDHAAAPRELRLLTPREYEILSLAGKGAADKEIAVRLGISVWTVRDHLKHTFAKLGVHTRTEAVVKALH